MDLVRYPVYDGGLLSLQLIESGPAAGGQVLARPSGRYLQGAADAACGLGVSQASFPDGLRALFRELGDASTAWGEVEALRDYVAYRRLVNRATVVFRPKRG
jgi:hypothetical protein